MAAAVNMPIKPPQIMATHRRDRRSISDSPTVLLSRMDESPAQRPVSNAMRCSNIIFHQSMMRRIGIMLEYSKPCFLKNS